MRQWACRQSCNNCYHLPHPGCCHSPQQVQVKQDIKRNVWSLHTADHKDEVAQGSTSAMSYYCVTRKEALQLPSDTYPRVRVNMHWLRLGYPCLQGLGDELPVIICNHCEIPTPKLVLHYKLECPDTRQVRKTNAWYLDPKDPIARDTHRYCHQDTYKTASKSGSHSTITMVFFSTIVIFPSQIYKLIKR